jgi:hypothetical protein
MRPAAILACVWWLHGCGGGAQAFAPNPAPPAPAPGSAAFGPAWVVGQDQNGTGWVGCTDYEAARDGDGCFIQFLSPSKSGSTLSGITLNGGLVDATAGKEQGDLDIGIVIDGKPGSVISFSGPYQGNLPGILMWPPDYFNLGSPSNRWKAVYLTTVACPPSAPVRECISVNGGFVPIYR